MDIEDVFRMIDDMVDVEFEDSSMLKNLKGFINQQAETIESLKCCGNCDLEDLWYGGSECIHSSDCNKCHKSAKESYWQPIK